MNKPGQKHLFRQGCLERLKKASRRSTFRKDKSVTNRLYRLILQSGAQTILLYLPLKTEVNLFPLIKQLRREKRTLYVPFMEGTSFRVVKYRLPLKKNSFGIEEPKNSKQYKNKKINMAVVPIVGVDITHRRVGFGKGMYDRFFEKEIDNIETILFVARDLCYSREIVTDTHDVKADLIVMP